MLAKRQPEKLMQQGDMRGIVIAVRLKSKNITANTDCLKTHLESNFVIEARMPISLHIL